jgi:hypothetical protein
MEYFRDCILVRVNPRVSSLGQNLSRGIIIIIFCWYTNSHLAPKSITRNGSNTRTTENEMIRLNLHSVSDWLVEWEPVMAGYPTSNS